MEQMKVNWSVLLLDACPVNESRIEQLYGGFEATIFKLIGLKSTYVLKVWNKQNKTDSGKQFNLLKSLSEAGVSVSKVYGYGKDHNDNPVLLTSYDGNPISKLNKAALITVVDQLLAVHQIEESLIRNLSLPQYDFISYFFPELPSYPDLSQVMDQLLAHVQLTPKQVIHGDYNLGNIVVSNTTYTIIDWTNSQLGDARYDIAWSILLIRVFITHRLADNYRNIYLSKTNYTLEELLNFEAMACIRLILLIRNKYITIQADQLNRLQDTLLNNPLLAKLHLTIN